ncbi:MAG: hypothetical protein ACI84E_001849, partial [Planctomycetota bacterium]
LPPFLRMREQSILYLAKNSVSWLTRGIQSKVIRQELPDEDLVLPSIAKAMLREDRVKAGACTLALDESHYKRRQLELPADLEDRELKQVLTRKANQMLGVEGKAVFQSIPLHGNRKSRRDGVQSWLLFAIDSKQLTGLVEDLRRAGFRVKRVVAAEVAYQGNLQLPELEESNAVIQIGQLDSGIGVSLFSQSGLVSQNVVPTGAIGRDAMGPALVQELRSMDSYWRQISEGGSVSHASFSGFDQAFAEQILPAAQMVLPNVELHFDKDLAEVSPDLEMLTRMLVNCKSHGQWTVDFTLTPTPHKLIMMTLVAASLACAVTLGDAGQAELETLRGSVDSAIHMRLDKGDAKQQAQVIQAEIVSMGAIESDFQAEWSAFMGTATTSIPYAQISESVIGSIGRDGALESLNVTRGDPLVGIQITGVVPSDTTMAADALDTIRTRLASDGAFVELKVSPEARVPRPEDGSDLLRFTVSGKWDPRIGLASGGRHSE